MNKIAVVVPTYNNFNTINDVIKDILKFGYLAIVVDDGSSTNLKEILPNDENLILLRHEINRGKGAAITTGVQKAKELGYEYVVTMDGDGQHLANQIKLLVDNYSEDTIIIGARNFDISNVPNGSKFGRWFSNLWACWDTDQIITDSLSGFRIYPTSILNLDIKTSRFDWEMEVLVKHAWAKKRIKEVIVECYYPKPEERVSHFKKFGDTMAIVWVHVQMLPFKWLKTIFKKITFQR
ncbi:glycosyltransferase family 2 protein [Halarcobacter ebronensis]|uniref:Glycosyl transferase n=1 Tax=Halarcobacter ebronensis TaxID=1462615 RepID=A0A4Q1ANX3_9BACT|nr:glycosyltransferase family 2 protein [Halarcobacter ebronensis]QKF83504.1 glycosyltransferase, family 2 [Halarcobacter ebronensis]RXK08298.1 glycosyl transferase [Halarcobacter ebronensis]